MTTPPTKLEIIQVFVIHMASFYSGAKIITSEQSLRAHAGI